MSLTITEYLDAVVTVMGTPRCLAGFIRKHSREFSGRELPPGFKKGERHECYRNSLLLASRNSKLTYVEGYAHRIIPVLHAWCVDEENRVVDVTWDRPEEGEYFGIPMETYFVEKTTSRNGFYGLLESPQTVGRMLNMDPQKFLAKRFR